MPKRIDFDVLWRHLEAVLTAAGPSPAPTLTDKLNISQPVFSRLIARHSNEILVVGKARSTRYALRRPSADGVACTPIFAVLPDGSTQTLALLHSTAPRGFYVAPQSAGLAAQFYDDLPFFLHDLRPAGFLGRMLPDLHPQLGHPRDVRLWSADQTLRYLAEYGWDQIGNLIIGERALEVYLQNISRGWQGMESHERPTRYPQFAADILGAILPGSSAAGEQPKFLTHIVDHQRAVLVKFSPKGTDPLAQRWKDLLICEHVALQTLLNHGISAASSEVICADERVFLEVTRFDRVGICGRRGVISLAAIDLEFVGQLESWSGTASGLLQQGRIDSPTAARIRWLELFGKMIANTDMHLGNIGFFCHGSTLQNLAPIYDMLPMLYAPVSNQLVPRVFTPPSPRSTDGAHWADVCSAALKFWHTVAEHSQVSREFGQVAANNACIVEQAANLAAYLPSSLGS